MNLAFPFSFDTTGRTAQTSLADHVNDMIELILFTSPGERVNLPTFGSGTAQLVFAPNSDVLAAAQQQAIQAGLQQWLSDLIRVNSVQVVDAGFDASGHRGLHAGLEPAAAVAAVPLRRADAMIAFCPDQQRRNLVLQTPRASTGWIISKCWGPGAADDSWR